MIGNQGKRPDPFDTSEKLSAYAFIGLCIVVVIWSIIN